MKRLNQIPWTAFILLLGIVGCDRGASSPAADAAADTAADTAGDTEADTAPLDSMIIAPDGIHGDTPGVDVGEEAIAPPPETVEDIPEGCPAGFFDCNGDPGDGCEADLSSPRTCGDCDTLCAGGCADGECASCDSALAVDSLDPMDAVRSLGLCWGIVDARWVQPDGSSPALDDAQVQAYHLGHGNLSGFGAVVGPMEGSRLLGLSSGTARAPSDPDYQSPAGFDKGYLSPSSSGFPKESPACPGLITGEAHDATALEFSFEIPENAHGFRFDTFFFTFEFPDYICSTYNDFFLVLADPAPAGSSSGNVVFDSQGNPISVNAAFLEVCEANEYGGKTFPCDLGTGPLEGTGFENHGATGWLRTTVPATPGDMTTLRLVIHDSGDGVLDSTALIDNFQWITTSPGTLFTDPVD